jgi:hypothetical protein
MSSPVLCIGPDTTLEEAAQIMCEQGVSCLPVVTGAFLVGIITRAALATVGLAASDADLAPRLTCGACGAEDPRDKVRRDPRSGGIPLCADCFGRTSPNVLRRLAD